MELDTAGWSGEGDFTQLLMDAIGGLGSVALLKVEDAPASRADAGFSFISNELFVVFASTTRPVRTRMLGIVPVVRRVSEKCMTLAGLESALAALDGIGEPDYHDETMLQYLRTQRIVAPYQTRGYKLVELVRVYEGDVRPTAGVENGRNISG